MSKCDHCIARHECATDTNSHTPLPWRYAREDNGDCAIVETTSKEQNCIAMMATDCGDYIRPADARFIVKACNSHYAMLAALVEIKRALAFAREHYGCTSEFCSGTCHFCANIRRAEVAIQKAEGE